MYEYLINKLRYCGNAVSCLRCPYWGGCEGSKEDLIKAANAIEELRKAVLRLEDESGIYDELPTVYIYPTNWIPVTERLPECYTWVLVFAETHEVAFNAFYDGTQWTDAVLNGLIVTHWMPLPEPPTGGEA